MAANTANVVIGAATISIGGWTANAGTASPALADVGHTKGPVTLTPAFEDYEIKSEQARGTIKQRNIDAVWKLKVPMIEATLEHWRMLARQASTQLTGTPPDLTLAIGPPAEQYHQVKIVGEGLGTNLVRTLNCWRCAVAEVGEISIGKSREVVFDVTFNVLYDSSVTTTPETKGTFYQIIDS